MTGRLRTPPLILFLVAALLVLLPLLAYFQYEWLGKVSEGERQELLRSLQNGAGDFRRDFDKEISSVYTSFELTSPVTTPAISNDDIRQSYAAIYKHWNETAAHPALVQRLILILYGNQGQPQPEQLDPASGKFETIEWPPELTRFRETLNGPSNKFVTSEDGLRHLLAVPQDPVDPKMPALFITILSASSGSVDHLEVGSPVGQAVVQLNLDYLQKDLIPSLVQTHFTTSNPDFNVAVMDRSEPSRVIYSNGGAPGSDVKGDITESLFSLSSLDLPEGLKGKLTILKNGEENTENIQAETTAKTFSLRIVRSGRGQVTNQTFFRTDTPGWQLVVTHRAGSLDAAVAQLRQKNLAISFSILLLLAFSVGMILISVRRERQLAQQQMEFVSTVSHELRTPLAVICSAGENLADGIIDDPERTRKYGALVRNEGRRLADMVEQVLDFAGIQSGRQIYSLKPVKISDVIERALAPFEMQLQERGVELEKLEAKASDSIPLHRVVQADRDVLIRAVQNLIGNALKYGSDGAWLSVRAEATAESVQIVVEDRGPGIPAVDLPHIFEPFYRGGSAVAAQIKGSGLGLALVKQIAEAHHGRVTVESSAGKGSRFAIVLPTAALS